MGIKWQRGLLCYTISSSINTSMDTYCNILCLHLMYLHFPPFCISRTFQCRAEITPFFSGLTYTACNYSHTLNCPGEEQVNECVCNAVGKDIKMLTRHREKTFLHKAGMSLSLASEPANCYDFKPAEVWPDGRKTIKQDWNNKVKHLHTMRLQRSRSSFQNPSVLSSCPV